MKTLWHTLLCKLGFHSMNGKTTAPYVTECPHCGKENYWGR